MRSSFGHMGDAFEGIREIYDSLPAKAKQRKMLIELAEKIADLECQHGNLLEYMGDILPKKQGISG